MYVATERETSDNTEATRFSQCAHDQRRRLEAEDCNSIRCAQLISGGRRRIRPCPPHCLAHARPTMCCIRLVIILLGECSTLWGERERGTVHGGRIRLLPPEINWAHRMPSQSSASSLLCWSCTHWLKCVASVISDVPLMGSHIEGGELGFD